MGCAIDNRKVGSAPRIRQFVYSRSDSCILIALGCLYPIIREIAARSTDLDNDGGAAVLKPSQPRIRILRKYKYIVYVEKWSCRQPAQSEKYYYHKSGGTEERITHTYARRRDG